MKIETQKKPSSIKEKARKLLQRKSLPANSLEPKPDPKGFSKVGSMKLGMQNLHKQNSKKTVEIFDQDSILTGEIEFEVDFKFEPATTTNLTAKP